MKSGYTQIPLLFAEYASSLEEGDLPKAVEANVRINDTSPEVESLLADFQNAIESGDDELAQTLLLQLQNTYKNQAATEQASVQRAIQAIEEGDLSASEREELFKLNKEMAQTKLTRSNFLNVAISYLEDADAESSKEVVDTATSTQTAEQSLSSTADSAEEVSESVELTSTPTIVTTASPSEVVPTDPVTMSVTVGNVGDAETGALTIHPASSDGVSPVEDSISIGTLTAGNQQQADVPFDVSGDGQVELQVTLQEDGSEIESSSQSVRLREAALSIREAITGDPERTFTAAEIQQAISYWTNGDNVPKTDGKTVSTDQIQQYITENIEEQTQ